MKIRFFQKDDAPFINSMLKREYGESYPYPVAQTPPQKDLLLIVEENHEVAAYARATKISDGVFEFGSLIVRPEYRGRGYAKALLRRRLEIVILENQPVTIFTQPVCYRTDLASQISCQKHGGFRQLGIQPAKHPGIHEDLMGSQPESLAFAIWENGASIFSGHGMFVPKEWREIVSLLCEEALSMPLLKTDMPSPIHHHAYQINGVTGSEFVDIPANWKESAEFIAAYRAEGYGFCALLPRFGKRDDEVYDLVRLYRYRQRAIDWSLIHITPDLAHLKTFMEQEEWAKNHALGAVR